jgi:ABC-2 type transport system permease protein
VSRSHVVIAIAQWEFQRWFKIKSTITTLIISLAAALAFAGGRYWMEKQDRVPVEIVVVNSDILPISEEAGSRFKFVRSDGRGEDSLRAAVAAGEYDGLLLLHSLDRADLVVTKNPGWRSKLSERLDRERRLAKMAALNISTDQLADMMAPIRLEVIYSSTGTGPATTADKIAAMLLILLMLVGVFNSLACQLVAITGEKQLRMTEQILSAVSPQQWIDGKILGISLFAAAQTGVFVLSTVLFVGVSRLFGQSLPIPMEFGSALMLTLMLLASVGGFTLWNMFFAGMASIINDPNMSSKTGVMFLPVLISIFPALLVVKTPDGTLATVLTLLPLTSPSVLPARLVLTGVPWWEIGSSLILLAAMIWLARRAAARTFRVGMLMFGKEPSFREVFRWIREA